MAIRSEIMTPLLISGRTDKFTKEQPLALQRTGISERPSVRKKKPSSPFGFSART